MHEQRLLERIRSWEREPARRERSDPGRLVESILSHLRCMLNTRQGAVPIAPEYGVPDFLNFLQTFPDSVRDIELNLRQAIQLFEPRLEGVQVRFIPQEEDALALRFQIEGQVRDGSGARVRFETVVDTDGKVSVRR